VDASTGAGQEKSVVTSLEERILQLLLDSDASHPEVDELPPPEAFLDSVCGNIFGRFVDLYREEGAPPTTKAVLAGLSHDSGTLDRLARILLKESACSHAGELGESLRQLNKRWHQHRLKELARQIREAQLKGESSRLHELVEEKSAVTNYLHELRPESR
jgi:hypothetical protein